MTDSAELNRIIDESGLKKQYLAEKIGISRQSLYEKINNQSIFNVREVNILCQILGIKNPRDMVRIFFAH